MPCKLSQGSVSTNHDHKPAGHKPAGTRARRAGHKPAGTRARRAGHKPAGTRARRAGQKPATGGSQARQRWVKSLPPDTRLPDRSLLHRRRGDCASEDVLLYSQYRHGTCSMPPWTTRLAQTTCANRGTTGSLSWLAMTIHQSGYWSTRCGRTLLWPWRTLSVMAVESRHVNVSRRPREHSRFVYKESAWLAVTTRKQWRRHWVHAAGHTIRFAWQTRKLCMIDRTVA